MTTPFTSALSGRPSPSTGNLCKRFQTIAARAATAAGAVVGLSAMAAQGAMPSPLTLTDGVYLFGESPVAETLGAVYFVFRVENQTLQGAIYQPSSSFDCVRGMVADDRLDLTVTDAYDQTEHPYSLAMVPGETSIANIQGGSSTPQLEGLYQIHELSALEHRLLATCAP
jgi:hypothetical protein